MTLKVGGRSAKHVLQCRRNKFGVFKPFSRVVVVGVVGHNRREWGVELLSELGCGTGPTEPNRLNPLRGDSGRVEPLIALPLQTARFFAYELGTRRRVLEGIVGVFGGVVVSSALDDPVQEFLFELGVVPGRRGYGTGGWQDIRI